MADPDKQEQKLTVPEDEVRVSSGGEEERLLEGMAVLDFDVLCSTVAMQNQGKWRLLETRDGEVAAGSGGGDFGGVFRMWEGELLDCFDDRRIAIETLCCPCYRFGKNMRRAGFGSPFLQGAVYLMLVLLAVVNCFAFTITRQYQFLYLALALTISIGFYLGFLRTRIRKKFNIQAGDSYLDDCVYHLICPSCSMCQEARTLEMNNVQDGAWHGRGDTICIGGRSGESNKSVFEMHPPPLVSISSSNPSIMQTIRDNADPS